MSFATKPALARKMIVRALDAGVAAAWVTGDEVYGADPALRGALENRGVGYVVAIGPRPAREHRHRPLPRRRARRPGAAPRLATPVGW
ncbi:transposase [Nocardia sputi]|uniref:transposase n=1 Tax=Nocardia TaxID=1817 RepID=UPI0034E230B7